MSDTNVHRNHRSRLRKRFRACGLNGLESHNMLELLLCYALPRKDTNVPAHSLIARFGSLAAVFDAPVEELMQVEGIGESSALLIRLFRDLFDEYQRQKSAPRVLFTRKNDLFAYLCDLFRTAAQESVFALYFNSKEELVSTRCIFRGSIRSCMLHKRTVVENGIRVGASFFVLAHNHPEGYPALSEDDLRATHSLLRLFRELEMPMADHFLVCGNNVVSVRTQE